MTDAVTAPHLWARSGAMALTGRPDGPPLLGPGRPAAYVRDHLHALGLPVAPLAGLLGERGAYAGLTRRGPWSCGGAMRVLPAQDGYVALSLPRADDLDLVPALVEGAVGTAPWTAVAAWLGTCSAAEAEARIHLLGMAGGAVDASPVAGATPGPSPVRLPDREVTVLDLSALWAGPLAGHLLRLLGARVVKVESRSRPDGARRGSVPFFELLDRGKEHVVLDLPHEVERLRELALSADVVVESSRPRALAQMGLVAEDVVAAGTHWVSITARGRHSDAIGFGDDVAACAGHVVRDGDDLLPVGDALADPLTGVRAAWAAIDALAGPPRLVEVPMLDVARAAASGPVVEHRVVRDGDQWWLETADGRVQVRAPYGRP